VLVFAAVSQGGISASGNISVPTEHVTAKPYSINTPAPTATAAGPTLAPVSTPTAVPAPAPVPIPIPTHVAPPVVKAVVKVNPPIAQQNSSGDHAMGATIPRDPPTVVPATSSTPTPSASSSSSVTSTPRASPASTATPATSSNSFPPGIPGLDVSGWQTTIDWKQVWDNGARFAYVKATEGVSYTSSHFSSQYNGSYNVGMIRGAYHFAIPNISDGPTQANYFVQNGGGWWADGQTLPPLLDIEYDPYTSRDVTDICYGLSQPQMVQWIAGFSKTVSDLTGIAPAIYTTTGWWNQCTGGSTLFTANKLFIARYPSNISSGPGTLPASWARHAMWQYASSGTFPGDQDTFNGSWSDLQSMALGH
jgi:GH25 family lysozyme M1 (1,4-beta-N-acetylmuramidase)